MRFIGQNIRLTTALLALAWMGPAAAQAIPQAVDRDSDGLIDITSLDDLNEVRNDLQGRTLRGSNVGCPVAGCYGYELTRDLDFDSNGNGSLDAGDWNYGRPWTPIAGTTPNVPLEQNRFRAVFDGNGHTIRNMRLRKITNVLDYGLFGVITSASIRSLRLSNIDVNIQGDRNYIVGGLAGRALEDSWIHVVEVDGRLVSDSKDALAGLLGMVHDSALNFCRFTGDVTSLNVANDPNPDVAGLVGQAQKALITNSGAKGRVTGANVAGLVETVFQTGFYKSWSNVVLQGTVSAAGLINRAHYSRTGLPTEIADNAAYYSLIGTYALGSIRTGTTTGAGLVGNLTFDDDTIVRIEQSYARNLITSTADGSMWANLVQFVNGDALVVKESYWARNPAGAELAARADLTTGGQLLADLQCATNLHSGNCGVPQLFTRWDAGWNFGTATELPALIVSVEHPWLSADSPNDSGDHENLTKLRAAFPLQTCENPVIFRAKEKNSAYDFQAYNAADSVLEKFDARQGLVCRNAQQADGACGNFSVRYLCDETPAFGTVRWTEYVSRDTPNTGDGDDESLPSGQMCGAGGPIGIMASAVGENTRRGPPRKLSVFNAKKGLTCLNSDGACKDYLVRMVCNVVTDRQ